jgi:hypothetical protein
MRGCILPWVIHVVDHIACHCTMAEHLCSKKRDCNEAVRQHLERLMNASIQCTRLRVEPDPTSEGMN